MNQPIEKEDPKVIRQFLTMIENHNLVNLLLAEYASSGMADTEFATYAMTKIKLRPGTVIKDHTIKARRDQFKIPANKAKVVVMSSEDSATILAMNMRIEALEERLALLEGWVNSTFPNKGPRKAI